MLKSSKYLNMAASNRGLVNVDISSYSKCNTDDQRRFRNNRTFKVVHGRKDLCQSYEGCFGVSLGGIVTADGDETMLLIPITVKHFDIVVFPSCSLELVK